MCGDDLEEADDGYAERLYGEFLRAAEEAIHEAIDHRGGSRSGLASAHIEAAQLHCYMDGMFADVLRGCITDGRALEGTDQLRLLSSQAVVLARAAGFLAARLDRRAEPLRSCLEALMSGYDSGADSAGL